jgi:hypothetical protein
VSKGKIPNKKGSDSREERQHQQEEERREEKEIKMQIKVKVSGLWELRSFMEQNSQLTAADFNRERGTRNMKS